MSIDELCNREVVVVERDEPVREAVRLMRRHHIGDVIVVEMREGHRRPVGILTDRDIVIELLAAALDLDAVSIGDAMSFDLVTVRESDDLLETIARMRERGVRRVPVVDDAGGLVGILAVDDILELVAEQLSGLVSLISRERTREQQRRP